MQAVTVLLLELAQGTSRPDPSKIIGSVEKLAQWLKMLAAADAVAERAYGIVCRILSRNSQVVGSNTTDHWLQESLQLSSNASADITPQGYPYANPQYLGEPSWPTATFNDDYYTQGNEGIFELNPPAGSLPDKLANTFQFGQEPYPPFYGNQFAAFDEFMDYDYGGNTKMEDWSTGQS